MVKRADITSGPQLYILENNWLYAGDTANGEDSVMCNITNEACLTCADLSAGTVWYYCSWPTLTETISLRRKKQQSLKQWLPLWERGRGVRVRSGTHSGLLHWGTHAASYTHLLSFKARWTKHNAFCTTDSINSTFHPWNNEAWQPLYPLPFQCPNL